MKKHDITDFSIRQITLGEPSTNYPPNTIRNQKYRWYTFPFQVFLGQFRQIFNIFFFMICVSQLIPALNVSPIISNVGPWVFVLLINLIKEGLDDYQRYLRDKEANSQCYLRLNGGDVVQSSMLRVGDIVVVEKNQKIPADMVLLKTMERHGQSFIRTDQLDGETDWKLRQAVPMTHTLESLTESTIIIHADKPHKDIYSFIGKMEVTNALGKTEMVSLSLENMLWMNTILATGTIYGGVIYTGKDTRAVMNTAKPVNKLGLIDRELNRYSIILSSAAILLSMIFTVLRGISYNSVTTCIRFIVIFSAIIPISLKVSIDTARYFYTKDIEKDKNISGSIVRNSNIPEELGRISYLLSDKTGTLTKNEMEMKKVHLGSMCYTQELNGEVSELLEKVLKEKNDNKISENINDNIINENINDSILSETHLGGSLFSRGKKDIASRIFDLLEALVICHNVTPVHEEGTVTYQASSPDEIAMVRWTEKIGFMLHDRSREYICIKDLLGNEHKYLILHTFPFTSEKKRMGIIVKSPNGEIILFVKGADVVMKEMVKVNDWLDEEADNMAREGLRTLIVAKRILDEEEYNNFDEELKKAKLCFTGRGEEIDRVVSTIEKELTTLGLTGVEDKLQDDVKVTLENLRNAGVKIWMLTGDKIETAISISISSRLFSKQNSFAIIMGLKAREEAWEMLNEVEKRKDDCIVIDGVSIQIMIDNFLSEFMRVASKMDAVVCCRCSPTQKAIIARGLRSYTKKSVCCIGDGGNDVSMIIESDVGIGIVGKEGNQASLAADFSITQFSHIYELLIWHGRNCYKGTSKLTNFIVQRGITISVIQAIFSSLFYFAPIAVYRGFLLMGYATVFTMFPSLAIIFSRDISRDIAFKFPELYKELVKTHYLSLKNLLTYTLLSFYQGSIIMLLSFFSFPHELFSIITITFSCLIIIELMTIMLLFSSINKAMLISEFASLLCYCMSFFLLPKELVLPHSSIFKFMSSVIIISISGLVFPFLHKLWCMFMSPSTYSKLSSF
ncbi:putative phospholipid-transporting ATPase IIB [Astathelohania contejeani]|uniref:Phospholipid-transporting ATPase n=1 Tax=Astathelohania contejeani TaxID=164912 RepID=A0ABQ7I0L1_9MICR|nr:putative phospholipid-transporting ATPase IIB [Thelohania contejeani]